MLHGQGRTQVRLAGIDHDLEVPGSDLLDWGNGRGRSQLDAMAGNADAYAELLPRANEPDVRAFLVGLAGSSRWPCAYPYRHSIPTPICNP